MKNQWRIQDLTGQKFNHLTAIRLVKTNPVYWECLCDCGNKTLVTSGNLKSGNVKSCGCLHKRGNPTHNQSGTRIYRIYRKILRRCFIENDPAYHNYGGRGITMCAEWKNSFEAFFAWANSSGYADDLSIDRIDNNGDYCPENCRWATRETQSNNRRSNRIYEINGRSQTLKQWCEEYNIDYSLVHSRLGRGWDFEEAVTMKSDARKIHRKERPNNG